MGNAGYGYELVKEQIQFNRPEDFCEEITEKEYQTMKGKLEYFEYTGGKIIEKSIIGKNLIDNEKRLWLENNTIQGLKKQIDDIKIKLKL